VLCAEATLLEHWLNMSPGKVPAVLLQPLPPLPVLLPPLPVLLLLPPLPVLLPPLPVSLPPLPVLLLPPLPVLLPPLPVLLPPLPEPELPPEPPDEYDPQEKETVASDIAATDASTME
jgi:hypothetical protein